MGHPHHQLYQFHTTLIYHSKLLSSCARPICATVCCLDKGPVGPFRLVCLCVCSVIIAYNEANSSLASSNIMTSHCTAHHHNIHILLGLMKECRSDGLQSGYIVFHELSIVRTACNVLLVEHGQCCIVSSKLSRCIVSSGQMLGSLN